MNEILALEQELLKGNFDEAYDLVASIKIMSRRDESGTSRNKFGVSSRQDRINRLETYLSLIISLAIALSVNTKVELTTVEKLRNYLIEIKQYNRLGEDVYIQENQWIVHYENVLSLGILKAMPSASFAIDSGLLPEGMGISSLTETIHFRILQVEVLGLLRLAMSLNACELDDYLRYKWTTAESRDSKEVLSNKNYLDRLKIKNISM